MVYEPGELRYLQLDDREVIRRWHVAVRDRNWGTLPLRLTREDFHVRRDTFQIRFEAEHRDGEIDFHWSGSIVGQDDGTVTFRMDGAARSTFHRNRIGFCLLHPIRECVGARCRLEMADGTIAQDRFPTEIAPANPFRELKSLSHEIRPGVWAELRFEGDLFETEDQRNWIDASFKTFCTPLRLPFPVEVTAGTRIQQIVRLGITTGTTAEPDEQELNWPRAVLPPNIVIRPEDRHALFHVPDYDHHFRLPQIGLGAAGHGQPLSATEADCLRILRPAHVRWEFDLTKPDLPDVIDAAAAEASTLQTSVEAAITVSDNAEHEIANLLGMLEQRSLPVCRWLIFHHQELSTSERWIRTVGQRLAAWDHGIPIYSGTRANFFELNQARPPTDVLDGICYSVQPQEHSSDNWSLAETPAALADTVETARRLSNGLAVAVTPITLRKRCNPYATSAAACEPPGELPGRVDPRQMSLFGAGWTLASLKYLAESGVSSVTFYETTGWLGVMETEHGSSLPDKFPSRPGMVFPLFHVLADAQELVSAEVLATFARDPTRLDGLMLRSAERTRIMIANLKEEPTIASIVSSDPIARVRILDDDSFEQATMDPRAFRAQADLEYRPYAGRLLLPLLPFAYARMDIVRGSA
jgi:hypothetical protein